jgi:hypothetical protein
MYSTAQIRNLAASLVYTFQGAALQRNVDRIARSLRDQGQIEHLSDLKSEVSRQAGLFGRAARGSSYGPNRTEVENAKASRASVQVLDFQEEPQK